MPLADDELSSGGDLKILRREIAASDVLPSRLSSGAETKRAVETPPRLAASKPPTQTRMISASVAEKHPVQPTAANSKTSVQRAGTPNQRVARQPRPASEFSNPLQASRARVLQGEGTFASHGDTSTPTRYYTYRDNVPLKAGQTVGYTPGKGYYVKGAGTGPALIQQISDAASGDGFTPTRPKPKPGPTGSGGGTGPNASLLRHRLQISKSRARRKKGATSPLAPRLVRLGKGGGRDVKKGGGKSSTNDLSSVLPSVSLSISRQKKPIVITYGGMTITARYVAEALVMQEHGSLTSLGFNPSKGGSLSFSGKDFRLTLHSVLSKTELFGSELTVYAEDSGETLSWKFSAPLGETHVSIGGEKLEIPISADVRVSVTPPNKVKAELTFDMTVWGKGGNLTTVQVTVSVDAEVTNLPKFKRMPPPRPFPFPVIVPILEGVGEAALEALVAL